jgi:tRNA threonylcarbamoyladenosine biosynthesis protein TsaE
VSHFRHPVSEIRKFINSLPPTEGALILLRGELGAGKTTLVQELRQSYGYASSQVLSPTFLKILEHRIPSLGLVLHMDLYRIEDLSDVSKLDLESYENARLWIVEWPEILLEWMKSHKHLLKMAGLSQCLEVSIAISDNGSEGPRIVGLRKQNFDSII